MRALFELLTEGGGEVGLVVKAWGMVSLGDWLFQHPYAIYVGVAVIGLGIFGAAKAKS
jgi:hypothetical protein